MEMKKTYRYNLKKAERGGNLENLVLAGGRIVFKCILNN